MTIYPVTFCSAGGYLRDERSELAIADISNAHELGYPAGTFGLATAFFLGDDVQRNDLRAEQLFIQAYKGGVYWAPDRS